MSVEIRVRRMTDGQAHDEVIEHLDTPDVLYTYSFLPDRSFQVRAHEAKSAVEVFRKVDTLRTYSPVGYLEVAGDQLPKDIYTTDEDIPDVFSSAGREERE